MHTVNRREFLSLAGGAMLGARAFAQTSSFPDLNLVPVRHPESGLVEADLFAAPANTTVAGRPARLLAYNGAARGPLLRVREGETVRLNFSNRLEEPTNLHLHGLHVSPEVDNPFGHVMPGEAVRLEFSIPKGSAGTYWFHPHLHGEVARQLSAGLVGVLAVDGPLEAMPELRDAEERFIVLRDLELVNGQPAQRSMMDWMNGLEGSLLLVNGASKPTLAATKPTLRLRFLNASSARYYRLQLEGHAMHLIATDGGFIGKPETRDELLLAPGERAEVLVRLERAGSYRLLNLPYDRGQHMMGGMGGGMMMGGMDHGMMGGSSGTPQTLLVVQAPKLARPLPLPGDLIAVPALDVSRPAVTRRVVITERMPAQFFLNGRSFDPDRVDFSGRLGALELWDLENRAEMDHPFHLHTYPFQVIGRNGRPEPYRAWKDTVNLRRNDRVRIAVPITDFPGLTVYHCHILEHEDRGMMGVLEVKP